MQGRTELRYKCMSNFVGTSPFLNRIWVSMKIVHLNKVQTDLFLGELFSHLDDPNKQFGVHKNLSWCAGKLEWPRAILFLHLH